MKFEIVRFVDSDGNVCFDEDDAHDTRYEGVVELTTEQWMHDDNLYEVMLDHGLISDHDDVDDFEYEYDRDSITIRDHDGRTICGLVAIEG